MRAEVPSMAMGDIAFNLLIFFVILARVNDDSHIKWQPAKAQEIEAGKPSIASVAIDVDNKRYLNGQPVALAELTGRIEDLLKNAGPQDRIVQFKIHNQTTTQYIEPTVEAISKAGADVFIIVDEEVK